MKSKEYEIQDYNLWPNLFSLEENLQKKKD